MQSLLKILTSLNTVTSDKKTRYGLLSSGITILLYYFSTLLTTDRILLYVVILAVLVAFVVALSLQISKRLPLGFSYSIVLPLHLIIGFLTTFYYFPNLGPVIKVLAFLSAGIGLYITFLVNNIFLVVEEKGGTIPLYNVAITWVQILVVVIAIPYISGILKIPAVFIVQSALILMSGLLLSSYMIWCLSFDPEIKSTTSGEKVIATAFSGFMIFVSGISTAFFPSETFLRSLFISSVLMLMITYIYGHYKNNLNSKIIYQNVIFSLIFFVIMLAF